jgi:hypothetical protein
VDTELGISRLGILSISKHQQQELQQQQMLLSS